MSTTSADAVPDRRRWKDYVNAQLSRPAVDRQAIIASTNNLITNSMLSNWATGRSGVKSEVALIFAAAVHGDAVEALEAAGYHVHAQAMAGKAIELAPAPAPDVPPDPVLAHLKRMGLFAEGEIEGWGEILRDRRARLDDEFIAMVDAVVRKAHQQAPAS